jgi:thymidine kinase
VLRLDETGAVVTEGNQVAIGGNSDYVSVCRRHYFQRYQQSSGS